jgi:predicted nucleotidyltransferase
MIPKEELEKAVEIARKYRVRKLYLIGSSLSKAPADVNDYDFAVSGVPRGNFFKFYGELFRSMSKNVDLIDLSGNMTKFKKLIMNEGKIIYDKTAA